MRRCARPTAGRTRSACGRASSFRRRSGQPARGPCHRRARSRRGRRRESPRSPSRARASRARSSRGYRSRAVSSISVDLSGKAALVTGAASGIGRAIAEDLASRGARVLLADIDESQLRAVAAPLRYAIVQRADISSRDDCRALVARARTEWGGVDILVNNAGLQAVSPIEDSPEDRWEHLVRVMLIGAFLPSDEASGITGSAQMIDMGWPAR